MTEKISNLILDEIMEITECGEFETYDFIIPETHCFIANGILVHNSGDLEQNADIVWGLWREDKLAEITEVNQLKGRDTGTYQITLKFDPKTQRFTDPPIEWEEPEPNYWDK